jgi:hypothetical protein
VTELERQIADELDRVLVHPVRLLLGHDLAELLDERARSQARVLAWQLAQDEDDRLAAQTVIDLMCALFPHCDPAPEWWRTPAGRLCARSLGRDDTEAVTRSVAAAMLGVTPGTIAQLVHRGTLARHPDGGISRASVLARLARKAAATESA